MAMKSFGSEGYRTAARGFREIGQENCQPKWVKTKNRGFYLGPSQYDPWSNDVGWKQSVKRELQLSLRHEQLNSVEHNKKLPSA